ncbi:MAG: hypothetical protein SOS24_07800 [Clostridia bacterium]|nr:hypothetical protein [Clostridia bacterium]
MKIRKLLAAVLSLGIAAGISSCGKTTKSPYDFSLVNNLGSSVTEVYISESTSEGWGDNLLGTSALENGRKLELTFSGEQPSTSVFDIAVLTAAGTEYQFKSVDLNTAKIVTIQMQDGAPVASIQ